MKFDDVNPEEFMTEEMLEPKTGKFLLVISNYKTDYEKVLYMGNCELEAYKVFNNIKHKNKLIVRATVIYSNVFKEEYETEFIISYEVIEVLKRGMK